MIRLFLIALMALGFSVPTASAATQKKIRVVATLPDVADLAQTIGGDAVEVKTLARPGQNLHAVRVKPSHLVALSRADLFIQVGLSLEHAWVPGLLQTARNRSVLPGTPGFISAGEGFTMIEVPVRLDRALSADVHPMGNPHINLSMDGGAHMAQRILDGLIGMAPEREAEFRGRHKAWTVRYQAARRGWDVIAKAVAGKRQHACLYHQEFDYLLGEMGLPISAFLEPRPGLAPTPSHLAKVIETVKARSIPVVLTAPWSNNKHCGRVAKLTGATVLELPVMVGGGEGQGTWIEMMDRTVRLIAAAYGVDADKELRAAAAAAKDAEPKKEAA